MENSIKNWSEDDRPREKLLSKGSESLSDAELLAILIGSGNREHNAVDIARNVLKYSGNSLSCLGRTGARELSEKIKGLGPAKAVRIAAGVELGKRLGATLSVVGEPINSSSQAAAVFATTLSPLDHEEFWLLFLNNANKVVGKTRLSTGGISSTVVDVRLIMRKAVEHNATGLIAVHNHPGGVALPSEHDITTTKKIKKAADIFDVRFIDHIIICSDESFFSFADENLLS